MADIPWKEFIDVMRFGLWIALYVSIIGLIKVMITEIFCRYCKHCGKKI